MSRSLRFRAGVPDRFLRRGKYLDGRLELVVSICPVVTKNKFTVAARGKVYLVVSNAAIL